MGISIRRGTKEDLPAIQSMDAASFGESWDQQEFDDVFAVLDVESFFVAVDGDRVVGTTGDYPLPMTVPGGSVNVPGVTWVAVEVTHRRQGVLRGLMREQLEHFRAGGSVAAILTASEGSIYGRYGYGIASAVRKTAIDRRRVSLREPGDATAVSRVGKDEARSRLPEIHDRWRATTPGALGRSDAWWDLLLEDRPAGRSGMSELFHLVHADGFASYRVKPDWNDGDPRHLLWIADYAVTSPDAHRDLWQVLLGMDLVGPIESFRIPPDDPLRHLVTDGRQIRTVYSGDGLWLRPLDIPALLAARTYAVEVDTILQVRDQLFGDVRVQVRGGPDGAECAPTDREADVQLDVSALGAAYLGGVRLAPLAAAGLLSADARALTRLDRALLADREPVHALAF